MNKPNFLIIGAQKAGSSWLAEQLSQHPDIFMYPKEIHYFDKKYNFEKGQEWYFRHFDQVNNESAIGEKTPDYLWANGVGVENHLPDVHKNIKRVLPDVKLIAVLRNPVQRAISALNHIIVTGRVSPLHNPDELLIGKRHDLVKGHGVLEYGHYYKQLKEYEGLFGRENILILIMEEDVISKPHVGLKKATQFLNVDSEFEFKNVDQEVNVMRRSKAGLAINYYAPWLKSLAGICDIKLPNSKFKPSQLCINDMYKYYEVHNQKLFNYIGRSVNAWVQGDSSKIKTDVYE